MSDLKRTSIILVGNNYSKFCFQNYFQKIYLVENNNQALELYYQKNDTILFLFDGLEIVKKIRKIDRNTIIIIITKKITKENLIQALPLHISGFIEIPLTKKDIKSILNNINYNLNMITPNICWLKNNYSFDLKNGLLFNMNHSEIKLTKNQKELIKILLKSKEQSVCTESIKYTIWEEESLTYDCTGRLKTLINSVRKKLPKGTISNNYGIGYQISLSQYVTQ